MRSTILARQPTFNLAHYLTARPLVDGALEQHRFDYLLGIGQPLEWMKSLSLESATEKARTEMEAIAWSIADVKEANASAPVTVVSIGEGRLLDTADHVYTNLGARLIREAEIDAWLTTSAEKLLLAVDPGEVQLSA